MYPSSNYFKTLPSKLERYLPHSLPNNIKQKRVEKIYKSYQHIFKEQMQVRSIVREIEISHLIGQNDVVINPLVEEYIELRKRLDKITETVNEWKSQLQELNPQLKELLTLSKTKDLGSMLYNDLKHLSETYDVDIDFTSCMNKFKGK